MATSTNKKFLLLFLPLARMLSVQSKRINISDRQKKKIYLPFEFPSSPNSSEKTFKHLINFKVFILIGDRARAPLYVAFECYVIKFMLLFN